MFEGKTVMGAMRATADRTRAKAASASCRAYVRARYAFQRARDDIAGQGTTEYAILVGVIVVIAIIAVGLFRGKLQELWNAIAEGINGL
mgnify:CR=1 FL=1